MDGTDGATEILYDDAELQVIRQDGSSDHLLISFGDLFLQPNGSHFFGDAPTRKAGIAAIGFVAKRGNWYPRKAMASAIARVQDHLAPYSTRVTYGGSMGGYAAVKFSKALGATHVISLCPQWSLDPEQCAGVDPGWGGYFTGEMAGMGIEGADVAGALFVFADLGDRLDAFHARKIAEAAAQAKVQAQVINVPAAGHNVTSIFAGTDKLVELVGLALAQDVQGMRCFARRVRRHHFLRFEKIIDDGGARHPDLCLPIATSVALSNPELLRVKPDYFHRCFAYEAKHGRISTALALLDIFRALQDDAGSQLQATASAASLLGGGVATRTCHQTTVIYDLAQDLCRHGAPAEAACCVAVSIEARGDEAVLFAALPDRRILLAPVADGRIVSVRAEQGGASAMQITTAPKGCFALSSSGLHLSAEPDGRLVCDRTSPGAWERFHFAVEATGRDLVQQERR